MSFETSALDIINWLESAVDTATTGKLIKERYKIPDSAWVNRYRSDCAMEAAYAFLLAWRYTGTEKYLTLSRELYSGASSLQNDDGSFPYYSGVTRSYTNDNAEVAIFLLRMAEIDKENTKLYRSKALEVTDYLLSIQNADGSWRRSTDDATASPLFTAHAVSALATAYKYTGNQTGYKNAIASALGWISGKILPSGMITLAGAGETQRPPSSDQAIVIRAFAHAELFVENNTAWRQNRDTLMAWFSQLITEDGAVKNGLGTGANGADTENVTDHVYTTAFAVEAFFYSFCADGNTAYFRNAMKILRFVQRNVYYSAVPELNGVVRGAFSLKDKNWDTSEAALDTNGQGGGNVAYTGWTNAPLAAHLMEFADSARNETLLSVFANNKRIRIAADNKGVLRLGVDGKTVKFPVTEETGVHASLVKIHSNGNNHTLAYC